MRPTRLACRGLLLLAGLAWAGGAMALSPVSYIVFFNSGKADISPQGDNTLKAFAELFGKIDADAVVDAHTDSAEASDALSIARGMAVRDRLIELGVPADRIAVQINADRQMLVPTGPNTREPQNRRVAITFSVRQRRR
jgi:OmpA-OmpF porin, OOP family